MSKKKEIVPRLRFMEFINEDEWETMRLEELASYRRGSFPQPYGLSKWYDEKNGMPFIQVFDVDDNMKLKQNTKNKISQLAAQQSIFIPKDTLIITIQGSIGRVAITQYDAYIDRTLLLFEKFFRKIDKTFLAYNLQLLFEIEKQKAPGGIIKTITKQALSNFLINIPQITEQQKIADCLLSIDNLIDAESRKLKALEKYKRGLMQKLFPAEGNTLPKWRFPEFNGCGDWEQTTLSKVAFYENGKAHENYIEQNGKYIVVNSKFIATGGEEKKRSNTANLLAKRGDVLMVLSDIPDGRAFAKCYFVDENDKYTVNQRICRLRPHDIYSLFLFYFINRNKYFLNFDDGVKQINLKKSEVLACPLLKPKEEREQQKIADCLSEIDTIITEQSNKIEQLKAHKKGLMQGLFPFLEEADA